MLCLNDSYCLNGNRCIVGFCVCSIEHYFDKQYDTRYNELALPTIRAVFHNLPSLYNIYLLILIFLIVIGLINNILSLMTFIRGRIQDTICGFYLTIYSICSLLLIILIITNIITGIDYDDYFFRFWTCHGYPYLSHIIIYTSILISSAISVENVLDKCFNFDKFRSRKQALIISLLIFIIVSISNLDKIFGRDLIINPSGYIYCTYKSSSYRLWSTNLFYIYIIISYLIHMISIICVFFINTKENFIKKIVIHRNHLIPSLFIIFCVFLNSFYHYLFHFCLTYTPDYTIRLRIRFILILYMPQILTFMIYIIPHEFYIKNFYQIWFYRKLCCCFYNKIRHLQDFEAIQDFWYRRTSLETVKTISSLNDICMDSEFYKTRKMES